PIPAIFGRIGSGARMTTRRVTAGERPPASTPASDSLGEQVELPGPRGVDLREQPVQPPHFRLQLGGLAGVVLVGREEVGHALVDELVLGEETVPLERQLPRGRLEPAGAAALGLELGPEALEVRLGCPETLPRALERGHQSALRLALVLQLP